MVNFDEISRNLILHNYSLIGEGSGRLGYDLGNEYVVKVAKNKKGIVQNKAEYQIYTMSNSGLFAKVLAISDNFNYLIMQKAQRIKSISVVWDYFHVHNNRELFRLTIFKDFTTEYRLLFGDLCRKTSWGLVNERPVIIDYGFTKETRRYYSNF